MQIGEVNSLTCSQCTVSISGRGLEKENSGQVIMNHEVVVNQNSNANIVNMTSVKYRKKIPIYVYFHSVGMETINMSGTCHQTYLTISTVQLLPVNT